MRRHSYATYKSYMTEVFVKANIRKQLPGQVRFVSEELANNTIEFQEIWDKTTTTTTQQHATLSLDCAISGLDAFCETSMVCTTPHSECSQGICACVKDYVPSPDNKKCLEIAQGFRAPCEESIQCSDPFGPDAKCLNMQCECRTGYHFAEMRCWPDKGTQHLN